MKTSVNFENGTKQHKKYVCLLTEVLKCLFDLLLRKSKSGLWWKQGCVKPVVMLVPIHMVCPQSVFGQLLCQQADNLHLGQIHTGAQICVCNKEKHSVWLLEMIITLADLARINEKEFRYVMHMNVLHNFIDVMKQHTYNYQMARINN